MKTIALVAALLAAPTATAGGFVRAKALEPAASYVAKKPVRVMCAKTEAAWTAYLTATGDSQHGSHGVTMPGSTVTRLDATVCVNLAVQLESGDEPDASLAPSVEVLTHEAIHARGEPNEGVTDCDAVHQMPAVAVRFFRVKPGKQLRALMAAAWAWRDRESAAYRAVC